MIVSCRGTEATTERAVLLEEPRSAGWGGAHPRTGPLDRVASRARERECDHSHIVANQRSIILGRRYVAWVVLEEGGGSEA
ncbi:hypothetical protein GTS_11630 [Gandjariella thermophila]|uniref:Uncharacterized protein n=1 Tax=Gandjariella thermophila TaxID=1931992 RepID=A0A4D4J339_9PSEU|nr:hypothetical protein GTS_11630 [Gandjariella thermophila]